MQGFRWRAVGRRPKVFCVGLNKTGTTSMGTLLTELGYRVGDQAEAELLLAAWRRRDFGPIIGYCRSADAFQDVPFSLDYTYQAVDAAFPGSKFVLTVRDDPETWYRSLVRFHSRLFGGGSLPTASDLARAEYRHRGWVLESMTATFSVAEDQLYDPAVLMARYLEHNAMIERYFAARPQDLLVVDLGDEHAFERVCRFLGKPDPGIPMPWENRSPVASAASTVPDLVPAVRGAPDLAG